MIDFASTSMNSMPRKCGVSNVRRRSSKSRSVSIPAPTIEHMFALGFGERLPRAQIRHQLDRHDRSENQPRAHPLWRPEGFAFEKVGEQPGERGLAPEDERRAGWGGVLLSVGLDEEGECAGDD